MENVCDRGRIEGERHRQEVSVIHSNSHGVFLMMILEQSMALEEEDY